MRAQGAGAGWGGWRASVVGGVLALSIGLGGCDTGGPSTPTVVPVPTTLLRGQAQFARYCEICHPGGGRGIGPALIGTTLTDAQITARTRQGKANMPAFGPDSIPDADLPSLVAYIRSLK